MKATLGALVSLLALLCGSALSGAESSTARETAARVVLIVWDGMRPDFMTEKNTPTLWKLAGTNATFRNHHSVYPTLTSVNATALATGVFPNRSGPLGNYEYRPEINPARTVHMDDMETVRKGDAVTNEKYLAVPTMAELVQAKGGRTAIAGTKSAPLLFDRKLGERLHGSVTIFGGETLPESVAARIEELLGPYPTRKELPSIAQDKWTTRALTEALWKDGVPEFSVLWLGDPDRSEHADGPGSATALAAIQSADDNLATVLRVLEEKSVRATTDVLIVSDHGFSTIARPLRVADLLAKDGFSLRRGDDSEKAGAIRLVGNGGTVFFYVDDHEPATTLRLVEWLQKQDFTGVIFTREKLEGTFPLSRVHLETPTGPDVAVSLRWNDRPNQDGVAGMIEANNDGQAKGTHGTLSRFDVHNIFVAAGPHFRERLRSDLPSSNLDVAATLMYLLDLKPPQRLDGRILREALRGRHGPRETVTHVEEATAGKWRQYLRVSKVGATEYIDEGNGGATAE